MIVYHIFDEQGELFRIVKTKWEKDKLVNTYKGFKYSAIKQAKLSPLELVGECLVQIGINL